MNTAPFKRTYDKMAYVFGTLIIIAFSFSLGRWPNTLVFPYAITMLSYLLVRRYTTYLMSPYYMYLIDFCYIANFCMIYLLLFDPKNERLFIAIYLFANGPLAFAIAAFRNSLVYHSMEFLSSLAIHAGPMVLMSSARWYTIEVQRGMPPEE